MIEDVTKRFQNLVLTLTSLRKENSQNGEISPNAVTLFSNRNLKINFSSLFLLSRFVVVFR
jgi:hypothetical protein